MKFKLDLVNDLIGIIWNEIEKLRANDFKFITYEKWKNKEVKKNELNIKRKKDIGENTEKDEERLLEDNLKDKYRMDVVYIYANFIEKIPSDIKRKIIFSSQFNCPQKHEVGLKNLINKIENGLPLLPHLSRQIFYPNSQDGMLFDFGISHLHLGITPDKKRPLLVRGHNEIVYCIFKDKEVYFLVIDEHGRWADIDLLRLVKKEFPELINQWKLEGVLALERDISEKERMALRQAGINSPIEIDGKFYMSPGGGINTAGGSSFAVMKMNKQLKYYQSIEKQIIAILEKNNNELKEKYENLASELNFKMVDPQKILLKDEKNGLELVAKIDNDNYSIKSIEIFP